MTLAGLLDSLPVTNAADCAFPSRLLGAFRRKSITFCDGTTDEHTPVYWFQSRTFTIDLRLPEGRTTPVVDRQGWVGDTLWDHATQQLSWAIDRRYQPRNQWPEPARLAFIGNCVLEFAPSGAYVEDWRQQSSPGLLLGLRLLDMLDETSGQTMPMQGGLIIAGQHAAYARSRLPRIDHALKGVTSLEHALAEGIASGPEIESYEVSVAMDGALVTHSTQDSRFGRMLGDGDFRLEPDGSVAQSTTIDGRPYRLRFAVDLHLPDFAFDHQTESTAAAREWMGRERAHLARNAGVAR